MTLTDHGQPADTPTKKHRTGLIPVLGVLAVALLAAGAWLIVDRQQEPLSAEEQQAAITVVVTAHTDAVNARDADAIRATLTDDFTWAWGDAVIPVDEFVKVATWGSQEETFTGDPVFSGDLEVTIPLQRVTGGVLSDGTPVVVDGTYTFTLREVDGQLKIATMVFEEPQPVEQPLPTEQQQAAIMEMVTANKDAINAGNRDALRATITDDFNYGEPYDVRRDGIRYVESVLGKPIPASPDDLRPATADQWVRMATDGHVTFTGDPVFSGDLQVAIPTRHVTGGVYEDGTPLVIDGTFTYTLREVDGELKIASIVFTDSSRPS